MDASAVMPIMVIIRQDCMSRQVCPVSLKDMPIIVGVHASAAFFMEGLGIVALACERLELARGVVARVCRQMYRQLHAPKKSNEGRGCVRLSHGRLHKWRPVPSRESEPNRLQIH